MEISPSSERAASSGRLDEKVADMNENVVLEIDDDVVSSENKSDGQNNLDHKHKPEQDEKKSE